jgi:ribonuclease HI
MLIDEFLCKREVLGKRSPHPFTPPLPSKCGRCVQYRLGVTLQMDLSYATIPVFGVNRRLYRESQLAYIINDEQNPSNHPIYLVGTSMGSFILQFDDSLPDSLLLKNPAFHSTEVGEDDFWSMFFDGACSKETVGAGVVFISPSKETTHLSFKLDYRVTNNIPEYEAFLLGLNVAKEMKIKRLQAYGDVDLIIQQVNKSFQDKHVRLKDYRDEVLNVIDVFTEFKISYIPRAMNQLADSLVVSTSTFIPPLPPKLNYEVQVKYRPSLPDNVKFSQVFEDDAELSRFLGLIDEFSDLKIDQDNEHNAETQRPKFKNKIRAHEIVQLSTNRIPKGLVPLERIFYHNDVAIKIERKEEYSNVYQFNVANEENPKYVNLASHLTEEHKYEYGELLK